MKTTFKQALCYLFILTGISSVAQAEALPKAPQVYVNLRANFDFSARCPIGGGYAVNLIVNDDLSLSPFTVPTGYQLILTGLDQLITANLSNITTYNSVFTTLSVESGSRRLTLDPVVGSHDQLNNLVVKPNQTICIGATSDTNQTDDYASGWSIPPENIDWSASEVGISGFLTKDTQVVDTHTASIKSR